MLHVKIKSQLPETATTDSEYVTYTVAFLGERSQIVQGESSKIK